MDVFGHLFGHGGEQDSPALPAAVERAVSAVEPLLKHMSGYPDHYRKPVATALEYARQLAVSVPGPVKVDRESFARDAFVHALFPSADLIRDALCTSHAMRKYQREFPASNEMYALMGMRRNEKTIVGMELSGQTVQRDVVQKAVYFTSHTIEDPAPTEQRARELAALNFFDSLVKKVIIRIGLRKQEKLSQLQEKDLLTSLLHAADAGKRPALEKELSRMISSMQATSSSLELRNYVTDFEAVLLHPEEYLRMDKTPIILDGMGIRRDGDGTNRGEPIMFNDLVGYDRRDWTVTMVHCSNLQSESFATRLDDAYRKLTV